MKQYVRYFNWVFVCVGVLAAIYGGILLKHSNADAGPRSNGECLTEERVFDYGEVLSKGEEDKLRKLIAKRERQTGCDIVLVTLNESLKEYAKEREGDVPYEEFVRVYAEEFYDENGFGYNEPIGDGVLLVDNWYREDDGRVYTWFCAVGAADKKYNSYGIHHLLDNVYRYVEKNPYRAYKAYINECYHDMTGRGMNTSYISHPVLLPFGVALAGMFFYVFIHWQSRKGKKTVVAAAYVNGGKPRINKKEDVFLNKMVTKRHIQSSGRSNGGSGGSRSDGSHGHGGRHGGGGHHR